MPLPVREFFNNERLLHLQFVSGDGGLNRLIRSAEVVRPAAAFASAGKFSQSLQGHVWVIGSLELAAFRAAPVRARFLKFFTRLAPAAAIFSDGIHPSKLDPQLARQTSIPMFTTRLPYTRFLAAFHTFLQNKLAPSTNVHGTFVSLFGLGVLIQGPSGVGKSEIALSLIERGHQLVADDTVQIRLEEDLGLIGSAPELGRHHMEIRGLGILNVRQLFGISAVVDEHPIHLVVDLLPPAARRREERLGRIRIKKILGVEVQRVIVQVRTGRHMPVIIEAAARNHQLRTSGYDAAGAFRKNLERRLRTPPSK